MKIKTFILTFLMMMSSPFLFGQQHWTDPGNLGYQNSMTVYAQVMLDNVVQTDDYQVAAFHGDELLEVGEIIPLQGTTSNHHVHLMIPGDNTTGNIYFKFFDGTKEYVSETEIPFEAFTSIGDHPNYSIINFKIVAQIGNVVYPSLQKAINACKEGGNTIELLANNAEDVTIKQVEGVNVTIDGGTSRYDYSGTITIHGNARYQGTETLTFKNIDFTTDKAGHYFIDSNSTGSVERYAHNVTVSNCNFTATGAGVNSAAAMRIRQGYNIAINGGTFTNLHSALQAYGNAGITVSGITLNGKNGISAGTSTGVVIENSNITATGYGLRADGTGAYDMTLKGTNTITAELPVVVRNTTGAYKLTVESGTYTALNSNPAVTFTTGDDGTFVAPTSPATAYLADGISTFGFEAKIGTVYHTTFVNAYAAAAAGDVITLLKDQNFSEIITLDKAITLDGGNYKLTSTAGRAINVDCAGEVTIKNLTIVGSTGCERGINIIEQAGITNIENVTISGQSHYAVHMATSAGAAKVNVKNSNLTGYGAFVVYGKGSVNTIENSTLVGINTYDDNGSNNFGTIVADVENTTITVTDGNIKAKAEEGKAGMAIFTGKNGNNANVTLNSTLALEGAAKYTGILNETTTLKVKADYATAIQAEGFATSDPDNGLVKVEGVAVAKIGETKYATLAKAITAAQPGNTIVLLTDITEDVSVGKSLTIDGENNTYTGKMEMKANITVKNVNFDGKGYNGYAVETRSASVVVIEDCTAKNYGYGFLQIASNNHTTTVKNVTISNVNYGVKVDYSNGVVLENVDINAAVAAVLNSNYGTKTITIKNSNLSILGTWTRNNTIKTTYVFEGENSVGEFEIDAAIDNFKLADVNSTLTAPNDITVTTGVDGYVVKYEDGKYVVKGAVAKIGDEMYASIAEAITAAQAGNTIVLLADITENVTVNKNVTIDGGYKNYTGTMTISNGKTVTVQNVNFVKGCIDKSKGTSGTLTVKDCTFDGVDGSINYAVTMRGGNTVTIEGGDVKNYEYGMLYVPSAVSNVNVKSTTVDGVNYGVHVAYGSKVNIEGVTMEDVAYGIMTQNYGAKTITIKNSSISGTNPIYVWERNTTVVDTFIFEGANTFSGLPTSDQAKLVLGNENALTSKLTAPEGYNVTSGVDNLEVIYKNGCYSLYGLSGSGTKDEPFLIYNLEDLKFFRDHVNAGKIRYNAENVYVALAADIDMASEDWSVNIGDDCNNTFDGIFDGKGFTISNLKSTETAQKADGYVCTGLFGAIYGNAVIKNLTIENVNINTGEFTGNNVAAVVGFVYGDSGKTVTIDGVNVTGDININASGVYGVGAIVGYSYNQGTLNINSCAVEANDESAITAASGSGAIIGYCGGKATIEACSVQNINITAKGLVGGIAGITENSVNKVLSGNTVEDVTLRATKTEWVNSTAIAVGTMDGNGLTVANTIFDNVNASRMVGSVYAEQPAYVVPAVEARIENKYYGTFDAALAAAQEGNTITVLAPVVITENKTYDLTGLSVVGENVYPIFRIQNGANVVVANGNISNDDYVFVLGASDGSSAGNLTIESGVYTGTTTVASVTKGLLKINGGEFKVNASEYGATYMINCIDANYNDAANVEIYGGKFYGFNPEDNVAEGANTNFCAQGYAANEIETGVYEVVAGMVLNQTKGIKYATLAEAIAAATANDVIVLLQNITENVTVNKDLTINGDNKQYTGNISVSGTSTDITVKNVIFVNGTGYAITTNRIKSVTVENCTVTNYGYGFLYANTSTPTVVVKNVTVEGGNYGFHWVYGTTATLENVTMTDVTYGLYIQNYADKTINVMNSSISRIGIWERSGYSGVQTFNFEGANTVTTLTDSQYAKYVLTTTGTTLTAPEGLNVESGDNDYVVTYENGVYKLVVPTVKNVNTGKLYDKLQAAIDEASNGDEIEVLKDIEVNIDNVEGLPTVNGYPTYYKVTGKTISIDLNGMTIKANVTATDMLLGLFSTEQNGNLTFIDSSNGSGTVEVVASDDANVYALITNYEETSSITINNGNYRLNKTGEKGQSLIYDSPGNMVINGGNFHLGNIGTDGVNNGLPWIFNCYGQNANKVIVKGGTFNADVNHQHWAYEVNVPNTLALKDNGNGTWTVVPAVAQGTDSWGGYNRSLGYASIADAAHWATAETTVTVVAGHAITETAIVESNITLDFAGEEVTCSANPAIRIQGNVNVTVKNGNMNTEGYNFILGASDSSSAGNLTIESGKFHGTTTVASVTKGNLNITGGEFSVVPYQGSYEFLINCIDANYNNGATVSISGGKFHNWNPENNAAEGANTNFCAEGYGAVETATDSNIWEVMPVQKQNLVKGWNWYSSYLNITTENLLGALGTNGNAIVQNTTWSADYYMEDNEWVYDPHTFDVSKMYMIQTSEACELALTGNLVDASEIKITLNPGWNWIGYPSNVEVKLENALTGLQPSHGDEIKNQNDFAQYYDYEGTKMWLTYSFGNGNMKPTQGYMYYNASTDTKDFTYNIVPATTRGNNETAVATHYSVDYTKYPFNMTMVAVVDGAMDDNYEVAALVNGEVRGSARPVYVEVLDAYMLFLTISGDNVEEVSFKYYDLTTGEEYDLVNRIDYSNNAMVGSVNEPYVLSRGTTGIGDAAMSQVNIYPNPTTTGTEINLEAVCDTVEVFNALGVKVAEYQNVDSIDALETAGIYVIRITNDGNVQNCRLVVK